MILVQLSFMKTKTNKVIELLKQGNFKNALLIVRTFKIGFTDDERRTLQIASESILGSSSFYRQLGIDTEKEIAKSKQLLIERYLSGKSQIKC